MKSVLSAMRKTTNVVAFVLFLIVVAVVTLQVIARRVVGSSITWADEISRFAFVWLVYIGGAITIRDGRNVCFDLLLESARGLRFKIQFTILNLLSLLFLSAITYFGVYVCIAKRLEFSPVLQLPMEFVCMAIPLGGLLMFFEQISYFVTHLRDKDNLQELEADAAVTE